MSSQIDAAVRHAVAPASPARFARAPWLLIGAVFIVAILLRQVVPLNTDVSWLLVVGERMLDGQQLYRDIIEINPPMAAFAYLPGVALGRALHVDARHVIDAQLLLLALASLLATWRIIRLSPASAEVDWGPFAIWAAAVVTILPMHVFGQREHIATLTFLPGLAVYALRSQRVPVPAWAVIVAGIGVGITLAFKPFFTFPAAFCILAGALRSRAWLQLLAPENIIAGVIVAVVSLGTYLLYPEYFTVTYPLVRDTYLSWSMSPSVIFLNAATLLFVVALASVALTRRSGRLDGLLLVMVLASIGFAISFYLQRRGWPYHSYPMVALAMLTMGYALLTAADSGSRLRRTGATSTLILVAAFALGLQWFNARIHVGPLPEVLAKLKPHPRLLVLSGEAAIGHPLVRDLGGTWVSRQENLWIREFVRLTRERTSVDAAADARLNGYLALERDWLIEDFRKLPPDLVLVDNLRNGWGDWARADAELQQLLRPYRLIETVEGIDILERTE
ncbi:hypothetical protein SSBR45G_25370 [Bradyrhizobium sp. SSBR45G]|uniref:hypothetical protein n=1 Tax=unclassified Bradyrhizobium TaxID=2631580 RepID=UPI002342AA44|nr:MULTISPECIES: hypothetical protein [unclassified Bradyrhizobium]GLH77629.1 hypothetical protein SSBR45G_25370 [Bradyrhizobium sp. SSBR45G]GLH84866.1 hypothetical protein SSBR45R_23260 [Bradyrhizobium sp. SSBR45R]